MWKPRIVSWGSFGLGSKDFKIDAGDFVENVTSKFNFVLSSVFRHYSISSTSYNGDEVS